MINNILHILQQKESIDNIRERVILYKGETYTFFDNGLTRNVFVNKDKTKIIKFLIDSSKYAHNFNTEEFKVYENASAEIKQELAETLLECDGLIIEQEFCNPIKWDNRKLTLSQLLFASKCRNEVGWNKDGNLVCFDLSEYKRY